jgi:BirA family transcriptional regulator, biotin operon repressor / biotin---[acetyl-CoA-carboxylase] ligase
MPWPPAEAPPDVELTRAFTSGLPGGRLAGPLRAYHSLTSTQTVAHAWAAEGAPEGAMVLADHQSEGRGRHGRGWSAAPGTALLFSVILHPALPLARWPEIPLAAGCAVAAGLEAVAPVSAKLKWPNDVLVDGWKLAGVLAEGVAGVAPRVVLGVGVNVSQLDSDWPAELAGRARSLAGLGLSVGRERLLTAILARLETWYGLLHDEGFERVRDAWRRRGLLGLRVPLADGEGTSIDLGPGGELVVQRADGRHERLVAPAGDRYDRVPARVS